MELKSNQQLKEKKENKKYLRNLLRWKIFNGHISLKVKLKLHVINKYMIMYSHIIAVSMGIITHLNSLMDLKATWRIESFPIKYEQIQKCFSPRFLHIFSIFSKFST